MVCFLLLPATSQLPWMMKCNLRAKLSPIPCKFPLVRVFITATESRLEEPGKPTDGHRSAVSQPVKSSFFCLPPTDSLLKEQTTELCIYRLGYILTPSISFNVIITSILVKRCMQNCRDDLHRVQINAPSAFMLLPRPSIQHVYCCIDGKSIRIYTSKYL